MSTHGADNCTTEVAQVEKSWYTRPFPRATRGWLVYTRDFVLETLQGCVAEPEKVRRTRAWLAYGTVVRCLMAVLQALIFVLAWTPLVSSCLETLARVFSRNAAGFFLRACYWKAKLRYLGQDTIIDQFVDIWGASAVSIGSRCHVDTNVRLAAGERRLGQHGSIKVASYTHLGPGVHIAGRGGVTIGEGVGIMANAHLYSATGVIERPADPGQLICMSHMAPRDYQEIHEAPILIEPYAVVGMMARIMPGVRVGRGAVIHANTVLTRDVQPFANIGGVPRGRRIGWRRPRRLSPNVSAAAAPFEVPMPGSAEGSAVIREVWDPNDWRAVDAVTDLHFGAFQEGVTTQLGRKYVYNYYLSIITEEPCSLWVAESNGRIVGFLAGSIDRHDFDLLSRSGTICVLAAWRLLTLRLSVFAALRALKKRKLSRGFDDQAELLSIVVAPEARRSGLGRQLLESWTDRVRSSSLSTFVVFTDNPEGLQFYEKHGGHRLFRFQMRSVASACFRFDASPGRKPSRSDWSAPRASEAAAQRHP